MSRIIDRYGSPVQQSMTVRPEDYTNLNLTRMMLGVVLEVYPADDERNRSSYQREDRRGYMHTCTVLVLQDGRGTHMPLENVVITPDRPTGLDDYSEHLPRGCTSLVTGGNWNNQFNHINPYDLDGDWCIVGFLGGSIDRPFIVRWWPHVHNTMDPATSAVSNPTRSSSDPTLDQAGRVFYRINGAEFVVTKEGNIYASTYRANSTLKFGSDLSPESGRFPRNLDEDNGGSLRVWIKPSQSFELDWNEPEEGLGVLDVSDPALPQTNPSNNTASTSNADKQNTYILAEKDRLHITVSDEIKLKSRQRILLESSAETTITVGDDLSISVDGDHGLHVEGRLDTDVVGDVTIGTDQTLSVTSDSDMSLESLTEVNIAAPTVRAGATDFLRVGAPFVEIASTSSSDTPEPDVGTISVSQTGVTVSADSALGTSTIRVVPTGVTINGDTLGGVVGGDALRNVFFTFFTDLQTAALSAADTAYASAVATAVLKLTNAIIPLASSQTVKVG